MNLIRTGVAITTAFVFAHAAVAQDVIVPTTPNTFLNTMLGALTLLLTTVLIPLAVLWCRQMIAERELKLAQLQEQHRATLDSGAQKAIGGAMGKIDIPPDGKLVGVDKTKVVTAASDALAKNFHDTFKGLGIENIPVKAKEIVESRLGMMDAQATGNPVPNPSQPLAAPSTQTVTVSPAKK